MARKQGAEKAQPIKKIGVEETEKKHTQLNYSEMIQDALIDLNNSKGVSREEIFQYLVAKYKLVEKTAKRNCNIALSNGVKRGTFTKIKCACSVDAYCLKKGKSSLQKPKTKKPAATPKVRKQFPEPESETASQHLPTSKPLKFSEMVEAAIASLKQRNGSSRGNILKYLLSNYSINENTAIRRLSIALTSGIKTDIFVKVKGSGGKETFKLAGKIPEAKIRKTKEKSSKCRKGKKSSSNASKQLSENIPVKKSYKKGISKHKLSTRASDDRTHTTAEAQTNTETTKTVTDMEQEHRKNSSKYE